VEGKRLNATLTFGMVVIPVGVVPVVSSTDRVSFTNLHAKCETPLKSPKYCPTCDKLVEAEDVVSGFRVAKDSYIVVTDEEKLSVAPNRNPVIAISKFVTGRSSALMNVVRLASDKSYWLPPQTEHVLHPYSVLARGMQESQVIGIAKATVWSRQWPVCIEVIDGMFALTQLHPASGVRAGGLDLSDVSSREVAMASTVIAEFTDQLDPDDLISDADDALKDLVAAKAAGKAFKAPELVEAVPTMDIMDALKATVAAAKGKTPVKKPSRAKVKA
jgi:DNA end-binding protein Ku